MENKNLLQYIEEADEMEIVRIMDAVLERYLVLYPQWDLNVFVLPAAYGEERQKQFGNLVDFMRKYGGIY